MLAEAEALRKRTALVLFTRAPRTEAKPFGLGSRAGRRLAQSLLRRTLDCLAQAVPAGASVALVTDETLDEEPLALVRDAGAELLELRQQGRGFEERFLGALDQVADLGFERLVAIGSDTPELDPRDLSRALASGPEEVVVGPSCDGGFYLLSLQCRHLDALRGLPWQSSGLLAELLGRLEGLDAPILALPVRRDVDGARDVRALRPLLERLCRRYLRGSLAGAAAVRHGRPARSGRPRAAEARGPAACRAPPAAGAAVGL